MSAAHQALPADHFSEICLAPVDAEEYGRSISVQGLAQVAKFA